jgi:hypothetical protein
MVSVVCEAFHCLPSAALHELQHAPAGLVDDVLELRAYRNAKQAYERACASKQDISEDPMTKRVIEIEAEIALEVYAQRQAGAPDV